MSFRPGRSAPVPRAPRESRAGTPPAAQPDAGTTEESLRRRLAELAGINAIGIALASTRDPDALLDQGLAEIVVRLGFGRGVLGVIDSAGGTIGSWRTAGMDDAAAALLVGLRVAADAPDAAPALIARADGPLRFRDADRDAADANRLLARALGCRGFVGTPLANGGRVAGVLVVADARDGRDLEPADGPLLYTVGSLFAGAIEAARLAAELEAQNRALEARVAERTRDLAAALVEAGEARATAEAANEAKSRFLANVSHELRTPLTSVVGFARLNRKRLDEVVFPVVPREDPRVERAVRQVGENLGIIVAEGDRLTGLINDLLDLARIEAGRLEWHLEPIRLEDVVDRALAATSSLLETADLVLGRETAGDLPLIEGDGGRLVQVVINLLSNAVKFTPSGGSIGVTVTRDGDFVRVAVRDSGRGIPEADLERIFEPFRQSSDTVPDGPKGTGLGLPIARQIVEAHGGSMGVRSAPGAGSTFWFRIPVRTGVAEATISRSD
ncbi:MAG: ATP-binding protein [Chloroflexota bacterium]